jgi:prefoldin subunit 5
MIGDTPISDSTAHNVAELGMLCRRLERQLNAANERIKELEAKVNELNDLKKWLEGR